MIFRAWLLNEPHGMVSWSSVKRNFRQYLNESPLHKDKYILMMGITIDGITYFENDIITNGFDVKWVLKFGYVKLYGGHEFYGWYKQRLDCDVIHTFIPDKYTKIIGNTFENAEVV